LIEIDLTDIGRESCILIAKEFIRLRCRIAMTDLISAYAFNQPPALHNRIEYLFLRLEKPCRNDWSMKSCRNITEVTIVESNSYMGDGLTIPIPQ